MNIKKQTIKVRILLMKEVVINYLPLIMLSTVFLLSIWLVRSVKQEQNIPLKQTAAHIVDYDFQNFNMKSYEINGDLKSSLRGAHAQHYLDTKNTEVNEPFVLLYNKNRVVSISAKKAIVNEEGTQVQLLGKAQLKKEQLNGKKEGMEISSEYLHFYSVTDTLISHMGVQIIQGNNLFNADNLKADNLNQVFELQGNVHATIVQK
jgi:lipopolysaccharide export system protein LptC